MVEILLAFIAGCLAGAAAGVVSAAVCIPVTRERLQEALQSLEGSKPLVITKEMIETEQERFKRQRKAMGIE